MVQIGISGSKDQRKLLLQQIQGQPISTKPQGKVLMKALVGFQRILYNVRAGKVRRNRKGADTRTRRRFNKLLGKTEWFKVATKDDDPVELQENTWPRVRKDANKQEDKLVEAVCFVPHPPPGRAKTQADEGRG